MTMSESRHNNTIGNPGLWHLCIEISADSVHAAARSMTDDSDALCFSISLDPLAGGHTAAIEEAVYSTPILLSDFGKTDIAVRTASFTTVPAILTPEGRQAAAICTGILGEDDTIHCSDIDAAGATVVWTMPATTANFLTRTFHNLRLHHSIAILARYFSHKSTLGNCGKTFVHFNGTDSVDIISFGTDGHLTGIISRSAPTDNDALFFILATIGTNRFAPSTDELLLCGDRRRRESLAPTLRRYIRNVLPVIFPSAAYRSGSNAADTPFPLTILPLCE